MSFIGKIEAVTTTQLAHRFVSHDQENKKILYRSTGNIFNISNTDYVLTCFHCIKNTTLQMFNNIECKICFVSDEMELALLSINSKPINGFATTDLHCDLNIETEKLEIVTSNKKLKCKFNSIQNDKNNMASLNLPILPFITVTLIKSYTDISELAGISGSLLMSNKRILGMVTAIKKSIVYVIPSCVIAKFINEIKLYGKLGGLCTLIGKFTKCNFMTESKTKVHGICVEDTLNINYNGYPYDNNDVIGNNLKREDVIIKVNELPIDKEGSIYDSQLNKAINFRTYIAFNYACGNFIQLQIMRMSQTKKEHKLKKIIIRARPLNSLKYIPITFNNYAYNYKGLIFVELSEDIINDYLESGIFVGQSVGKYYLDKPYRSDSSYVIALIDIKKKQLNNELVNSINRIGLPLINTKAKFYSIPYVSKLNNKKVNTLAEFEKVMETNSEITIKMHVNESHNIKIIIKNRDVCEIKTDT
jgi:hypothetical protein